MTAVLREVYIDNVLMDVNEDSQVGYIFNSPIFRDITQVLSNRTTTYKLPKTDNNLTAIGLSNKPEVDSEYPYRFHDIVEYRNGLLFITGRCALLSVTDTNLEFYVMWGNAIKMLSLKDLNLRDLEGKQYVDWSKDSTFMLASNDTDRYGFLAVDYGKGLTDFNYIYPSVSIQGVLDIITTSSGVKFEYPDQFTDVFKKTWIPLLEKNANQITWGDMLSNGLVDGYRSTAVVNVTSIKDPLNIFRGNGLLTLPLGYNLIEIKDGIVSLNGDYSDYRVAVEIGHAFNGDLEDKYYPLFLFDMEYNSITNKSTADINLETNITVNGNNTTPDSLLAWISISLKNKFDGSIKLMSGEALDIHVTVSNQPEEVPFGYKYPIIPNLPDMKVIDFLKLLMQMYGLWTYYNFREDDVIEFTSLNKMYELQENAYDWSNKLVNTSLGQFNLTYTYGDYAQNNLFKYKNDSDIKIDADGSLAIDNTTLPSEDKTLVDIEFSPSISATDNNDNVFAYLGLFDSEGETQSIKNRVLKELKKAVTINEVNYKTALFDKSLYFGGDDGLVNAYYPDFQRILRHPVIAQCYVYLQDVELHQYKEAYPVYIDGVYYMPIKVTVQTDGLAVVDMIRMPYKEESPN